MEIQGGLKKLNNICNVFIFLDIDYVILVFPFPSSKPRYVLLEVWRLSVKSFGEGLYREKFYIPQSTIAYVPGNSPMQGIL